MERTGDDGAWELVRGQCAGTRRWNGALVLCVVFALERKRRPCCRREREELGSRGQCSYDQGGTFLSSLAFMYRIVLEMNLNCGNVFC